MKRRIGHMLRAVANLIDPPRRIRFHISEPEASDWLREFIEQERMRRA